MAKQFKKVKLELLVKEYFSQNVYPIVSNKAGEFMIIRDGNLEFYQAKKKSRGYTEVIDSINIIKKYPLSELSHVTIDYFVLSTKYVFSNNLQISVYAPAEKKDKFQLQNELVDIGITAKVLERKWYNKILGFRSKKIWKMAIASIFYFIFIYVNIVGFLAFLENEKHIRQEQAIEQENREKQREERAREKEERKKEQQELEENKGKAIIDFKNNGIEKLIEEYNVVQSIEVKENSIETIFFDVYVDEESWSELTNSKKLSLAASLETYIEKEVDPYSISMDVYSHTNEDKLAQRTFFRNRWEIIR
ncbi:hypothetical protein [Bacillus sp. Au-Bac7]|uniref:hypothetical protein n=1 Tax=Bacillus sp. Au-Bac7 TaxID=2906458 RepID=UPI001E638C46|nr:hypothetical protein [Bacillus sp. Au-Bac7]MCE4049122.1 hypothetical protein [Bacillus sp. Au-Bac7]